MGTLLPSFANKAIGQPVSEVCFPLEDAQALFRDKQTVAEENRLLKVKIDLMEVKIALIQKEKELVERESVIKDKLIEVEKRATQVANDAYERMKEQNDRTLKLAEIMASKAKSNWQWEGLLKIVEIGLVVLAIASK